MKIIVLICGMMISILLPGFSQGQKELLNVLERVRHSYQELETVTGKLEIIYSSPEPGCDFTVVHLCGTVRQKKVVEDTLIGWHFANDFCDPDDLSGRYKTYYTGDSLTYFYLQDSSVTRRGGENGNSEFGFSFFQELKEKLDLFYSRLTLEDRVFEKTEGALFVGKIALGKDTLIEGRACFLIENRQEKELPAYRARISHFEKIAVDKEYYYPIFRYTHRRRYVDGKGQTDQKCWSVLSGYQINGPVADSFFVCLEKTGKRKAERILKQLVAGDKVPDWNLVSVAGDTMTLYQEKGEFFILEFGYIGCGACTLATRELIEKVTGAFDSQRVRFIYINPVDSFQRLKLYAAQMNITYPLLKGNEALAEKYGITGYPAIFILNKDFVIRKICPGYFAGMGELIRATVHQFLSEN